MSGVRRRNSITKKSISSELTNGNNVNFILDDDINHRGSGHYYFSNVSSYSQSVPVSSFNKIKPLGKKFDYHAKHLSNAKMSNQNLVHMDSRSTMHRLQNRGYHSSYKSSRSRYIPKMISSNIRVNFVLTLTLFFVFIFYKMNVIPVPSLFDLVQSGIISSDQHYQHKHKRNKMTHEIEIILPDVKSSSTKDNVHNNDSQNLHLRSPSFSSNSKDTQISKSNKQSNDEINTSREKQKITKDKKESKISRKKKNSLEHVILNSPKDFFYASSNTSRTLWNSGYAHLPFPIYCPLSNTSSQKNKSTCQNGYFAWSATLWIYPNMPISHYDPSSSTKTTTTENLNKRVIFSSSLLELYLDSSSQLILEYYYSPTNSSSSMSKIKTKAQIPHEEWSHIGIAMVPNVVNDMRQNFKGTQDNKQIEIRLYIEGKEEASQTVHISSHDYHLRHIEKKVIDDIDRTCIGQDCYQNNNGFEGYMAMLAIWTNTHDTSNNQSTASPPLFRDDFIIKSSHRAGLDERDLMFLEQQGLVKSPNFVYPLRTLTHDNDGKVPISEQPTISILNEIMQHYDGIHYRPNILLHPYPFTPTGSGTYPEYIDGNNKPPIISTMEQYQYDSIARLRRIHIRNAMKHVWQGYKRYAYGKDELKPLSKKGHDNWGGMCTTLIDSLDTLWLMNMKEEFWEGRDWIQNHLNFNHVTKPISVFETTIRNLGGLLSAYDLSGEEIFLNKAEELGERMLQAFDSPSGLPYSETDLNGEDSFNTLWLGRKAILAEMGTLQLEFRYLGKVTGKPKFSAKATRALDTLIKMNPSSGLYPLYIRNDEKPPIFASKEVSFGAMGDSFYEYLLKVWIQGGKREKSYRLSYDKAIDGLVSSLLQKSSIDGLTYVATIDFKVLQHKMDHLVCFLPGTLALGAYTDPNGLQSDRAQRDLRIAKSLVYTCYQMYARTTSGMASESVEFPSKYYDFTVPSSTKYNILRPETVESLYILHKLTGDNVYREWGWEIFRALEECCRVDAGYASLLDVNDPFQGVDDRMESFFLAETLKYLYLLQDPDSSLDILNEHVLNTEAHPLRMFDQL